GSARPASCLAKRAPLAPSHDIVKALNAAGVFLLGTLCALAVPAAALGDPTVPAPEPLPPSLTLEQALQRFREKGFDLLLADAAVQSAEGALRIAGAVYNPSASRGLGKAEDCSGGESGDR